MICFRYILRLRFSIKNCCSSLWSHIFKLFNRNYDIIFYCLHIPDMWCLAFAASVSIGNLPLAQRELHLHDLVFLSSSHGKYPQLRSSPIIGKSHKANAWENFCVWILFRYVEKNELLTGLFVSSTGRSSIFTMLVQRFARGSQPSLTLAWIALIWNIISQYFSF